MPPNQIVHPKNR